jgi:hypothetical protein
MHLSVSYLMKECGLPTVAHLSLLVLHVVSFSLSHFNSFVIFSLSLLFFCVKRYFFKFASKHMAQ